LLALLFFLGLQQVEGVVGEPTTDVDGIIHLPVSSPAQSGPVELRFLAPTGFKPGGERRFLFILPVEKQGDSRYGDGLAEARRLSLHEKHGWILVAPGFAELPWYADHPSDRQRQDETFLLKTVIPLAEKRYPGRNPKRLLLGFSKSGWGAWSLLLRHPDLFGAAAAWDAPLMKEKPDQFGMQQAFATEACFQEYCLSALLRKSSDHLGERARLAHFGFGNFRVHHERMQNLLRELGIPSVYHDGPRRDHLWGSGWMEEAASALEAMTR